MSIPTSRDSFKDYCLRALGAPVLQVNVDDTQVEDRVDEALYLYQQFHMDGVVKLYLPLVANATFVTVSYAGIPDEPIFQNGEVITKLPSDQLGSIPAAARIVHFDANTFGASSFYIVNLAPGRSNALTPSSNLQTMTLSNTGAHSYFTAGDTIVGQSSGANAFISNITSGNYDNGFFPVPEAVIAVTRIIGPFENRLGGGDILFDPQVQFTMSLQANFVNTSLIPYVMGRQYQTLLQDTIYGKPAIRYQRHQNRLYVDLDFKRELAPGSYVVAECYAALDPVVYTNIWSDEWLQRYTIALIKRQWAQNLSKYQGIALPGGVTLDAKSMMQEAVLDIKDLRDELKTTYQNPIDFFIG